MGVKIRLHPYLKDLTGGRISVEAAGQTVAECIDNLDTQYPGIRSRLCDQSGQLRSFYNVFLDSSESFHLLELKSKVNDGDKITILALISGG